jgi:serine/threonine protein kinase
MQGGRRRPDQKPDGQTGSLNFLSFGARSASRLSAALEQDNKMDIPLAPGTHLGPYEIASRLGAGGMGEVYRARDTRLDRTVAIKVAAENFSDRFEREARSIAALNHSNICTLYDVGPNFLVMEYIEGETLDARIQRGALPVREALQYAVQIAAALDAAHRRGIVHRDLKPANVMLSKSVVKLLDFGLAKTLGTVADAEGETLAITARNTIVGTVQYMSPEQLEGKEADARSDIFAFGLIMYEMLTGRKAFAGTSQATLIASIMTSDPAPLSVPASTNLAPLERVVGRCLAKSPDDRWQCAHDLRAELQWISEAGAVPEATGTVTRKPQLLPWVLAALLAIVSAVLVFVRVHQEPPEPAIPARFSVSVPEGRVFAWYDGPSVSPDGERIVIAASEPGGAPTLFLRSLRSSGMQQIPGTEGAYFPFWSPDSKHVAFFSMVDRKVKRVDLAGGAPQVICELSNCRGGQRRCLAPRWVHRVRSGTGISATSLRRGGRAGRDSSQRRLGTRTSPPPDPSRRRAPVSCRIVKT